MKHLITPENVDFGSIVLEFIFLLIISGVLFFIFNVIVVSAKKLKNTGFKQKIKLSSLTSLIYLMVGFVIYFTVFVAINGKEAFSWGEFSLDNSNTYYQVLPQMLVYILMILTFILISGKFKKELKRK